MRCRDINLIKPSLEFALLVKIPQAILALPDPTEWERDPREKNARYHQTLEFAPVPSTSWRGATTSSDGFAPDGGRAGGRASGGARESRFSGKSIFCGVSAARQEPESVNSSGGRRSGGRTGRVTVVSFEPTLSLTNLLAARADVRLSCLRAPGFGASRMGWSACFVCVVPAIPVRTAPFFFGTN